MGTVWPCDLSQPATSPNQLQPSTPLMTHTLRVLCLKHLQWMIRGLQQEPDILYEYDSTIKEQIKQGIIEPVEESSEECCKQVHYLPQGDYQGLQNNHDQYYDTYDQCYDNYDQRFHNRTNE